MVIIHCSYWVSRFQILLTAKLGLAKFCASLGIIHQHNARYKVITVMPLTNVSILRVSTEQSRGQEPRTSSQHWNSTFTRFNVRSRIYKCPNQGQIAILATTVPKETPLIPSGLASAREMSWMRTASMAVTITMILVGFNTLILLVFEPLNADTYTTPQSKPTHQELFMKKQAHSQMRFLIKALKLGFSPIKVFESRNYQN